MNMRNEIKYIVVKAIRHNIYRSNYRFDGYIHILIYSI